MGFKKRRIFGVAGARHVNMDDVDNTGWALPQHDDSVGKKGRFQHVVGDEQPGRRCLTPQFLKKDSEAARGEFVKRAKRLVKKENFGFDRECTCKGDALTLSSRERRWISVGIAGKTDRFEKHKAPVTIPSCGSRHEINICLH